MAGVQRGSGVWIAHGIEFYGATPSVSGSARLVQRRARSSDLFPEKHRKSKMADGRSAGGQRIRSLVTRAKMVPLKFTLGTSAAIVKAVPLLLVDLLNEDGVTGRAYAFCYRPSGAVAISSHLFEAVDLLKGKSVTPFDATQTLSRQFALLGVTGAVRMALSLLDMALWDAMAQMQRAPLSSLLGSRSRPLLAYDSRGLGLMEPDRLAEEAQNSLSRAGSGRLSFGLDIPLFSRTWPLCGQFAGAFPAAMLRSWWTTIKR